MVAAAEADSTTRGDCIDQSGNHGNEEIREAVFEEVGKY